MCPTDHFPKDSGDSAADLVLRLGAEAYAPALHAVAIWCLLAAIFLVSSSLIAVQSSNRGWFFWFIFSDGCFGIVFAFCILLLLRSTKGRLLDAVYPDAGRGWE